MSYFEKFKNERYHDKNLISSVNTLAQKGGLAFVKRLLQLEGLDIGNYSGGFTKKDYDVHLEFEKAVICIETKVDSFENAYYEQNLEYQTEKIFQKYENKFEKPTFYRYLTYGTSEFYIKKTENGTFKTGPFSKHFQHIKLNDVIEYLSLSDVSKENPEFYEWLKWLNYESYKRENWARILKAINDFRKIYIGKSGLTDWPNNRLNICIPEILILYYSKVGEAWNSSEFAKTFGSVTVYPVGRYGKVNDAIMNFSEINVLNGFEFALNGLLSSKNSLYFEFNEDFNLHLKCLPNIEADEKRKEIYEYLIRKQEALSGNGMIKAIPENYKQGSYVFFEWDLNILDFIDDIPCLLNKLSKLLKIAIEILK